MTKSKSCNHCKKEFNSKRERKYCSNDCYNNYRKSQKVYKECAECKKEITRSPSHFERVEKPFCSRSCRNNHMVKENHHAYDSELHKDCVTCGKYIDRAGLSYCSVECVNIKGENNTKYLERLSLNCDQCGSEIKRTKTFINDTNFCTKDCQNTFHSERMKGENNPKFKDGIWLDHNRVKRSYAGFTLKLRKSIRKRDSNECQVCSMNKEDHGMNMHVHHIDYDKYNNDHSNLICVCRYCHGKIHGDEKAWLKILSKK